MKKAMRCLGLAGMAGHLALGTGKEEDDVSYGREGFSAGAGQAERASLWHQKTKVERRSQSEESSKLKLQPRKEKLGIKVPLASAPH